VTGTKRGGHSLQNHREDPTSPIKREDCLKVKNTSLFLKRRQQWFGNWNEDPK